MLVECVARPELKEPVLELIGRVSQEHKGGKFAIPMAEMFKAFVARGEQESAARKSYRGPLIVTAVAAVVVLVALIIILTQ